MNTDSICIAELHRPDVEILAFAELTSMTYRPSDTAASTMTRRAITITPVTGE